MRELKAREIISISNLLDGLAKKVVETENLNLDPQAVLEAARVKKEELVGALSSHLRPWQVVFLLLRTKQYKHCLRTLKQILEQ